MSESDDLLSDIDDGEKKLKRTYDPRLLSGNRKVKMAAMLEEKATWGNVKERYHKDEPSSDEDSEAQEGEEMEAEYLAKKNQEKIGQDDYWDQFQEESQQAIDEEPTHKQSTKFNIKAVSALAKALNIKPQVVEQMKNDELKQSIMNVWPEILDIFKNVDLYTKKMRQAKVQLKKATQRYMKEYITLKLQSYAAYLTLLLFFLQLRSKTQLSQDHSIFQKIIEAKQQVAQVEDLDLHVRLLDANLSEKKALKVTTKQSIQVAKQRSIPTPIKAKKEVKVANQKQLKVDDILNKIDEDDLLNRRKKVKVQLDDDDSMLEDLMGPIPDNFDGSAGEDDFYAEQKEKQIKVKAHKKDTKTEDKLQHFKQLSKLQTPKQVLEDEARTINYVMLKKKSLMQRRRGKRSTNSRVKHKVKYDKALQKQKTMGHLQRTATSAFYTGEKGVKANVIKSVKFK